MTMIDIGCWERGCACYDSRIADETVEVVRRDWVGLTDEEIHQIFIANSVVVDNGNAYMVAGLRAVNITRAIEAAHGIKGEA